MHTGKISEIAYKRSVLKKVSEKTENLQVGVDASKIALGDVTMVTSSNCILKWFSGCEEYYLKKTFNGIYSSGGQPKFLQLKINIPNDFEEKKLGKIIKAFDEVAKKEKVIIQRCDAYASDVKTPIIHVDVIGVAHKTYSINHIKEGMEVIMAGTVAVGASAVMAHLHEEQLRKKFHSVFVDDCMKIREFIDVSPIADIAKTHNIAYMHNISDGGVFGASWELASAVNAGIEIDVNRIPVWQEAIEIAEIYGYNPYMVDGTGAILIVTKDGEALVGGLQENGIYADIIGKITSGKDRVVKNGDEKRFLEPPRGDEIYNFI